MRLFHGSNVLIDSINLAMCRPYKDFGEQTTEEWAKFVMNNRSRAYTDEKNILCNKDNKYDIVIGPVADDNMALLFRQYENEIIDFATLLRGMIYKKTSSQYSFHTEKSIMLLRKRWSIKMCKKSQLIEYIIQDIVDMIAIDQNIEYDEAMNKFYNSEVFEKLQDKETGLYLESSEYVYDLFKDEMNFGHIIQAEI
ncbi:MAG: DUF3990 domain-containing protein [Lacrimispora saccharolytica]